MAESTYQLAPIHDGGDASEMDIVFVHGLGGDARGTWRRPEARADDRWGWPAWLGQDLTAQGVRCRIFSFDTPDDWTGWKGHALPIFDRGEQLLEHVDLMLSGDSRLFFIGHSLGGLIIKSMLHVSRHKPAPKGRIPQRTAGVLFLGTPHEGSGLAHLLCHPLARPSLPPSATVEELRRCDGDLAALYDVFVYQARRHGWAVHQFWEAKKTNGVRIVDRWSAFSGVGDVVPVDEDHIAIAKPASRGALVYLRALSMMKQARSSQADSAGPDLSALVRAIVREELARAGEGTGGGT